MSKSHGRKTDRKVLALIAVLCLVSPYFFGSVQPWAMDILVAGIFVALLISLGKSLDRGTLALPDTRLVYLPPAIILFAVIQTVPLPSAFVEVLSPGFGQLKASAGDGSTFSSIALYPWKVWDLSVYYTAVAVAFLLVLRHLKKRRHAMMLLGWPIANGVVLALLAFLQKGGAERTYLPFINRNHFAGYMEILVPMAAALLLCNVFAGVREGEGVKNALVRAFTGPSALMSVALSCTLVITTGAVFLTASRGGALSLLASFFVLSAALARKKTNAGLLVGIFVAVSLAGLVLSDPARVAERFGRLGETGFAESLGIRYTVWKDTLGMVTDYPLMGVGLGSFENAYPSYKTLMLELNVFQPENDYLYILAEGGVAGLALFGVFGAMLLVELVRLVRKTTRGRNELCLGAGALAALSALLVHGLVDTNLHMPATLLTLAVFSSVGLVAMRGGLSQEGRKRSSGYPKAYHPVSSSVFSTVSVRMTVIVVMAAASLAVLSSGVGFVSDMAYRKGLRRIDEAFQSNTGSADRLKRAVTGLRLAGRLSPLRADIPFELGRANFSLNALKESEGEAEDAEGYARKSVAAFQKSLSRNPYSSFGHLMLGRALEHVNGSSGEIEDEYLRSERLNPTNPLIKSYLAEYYEKRGDDDKARRYADMLPYLDPGYNVITIYDLVYEPDVAEAAVGETITFKTYAEVMVGDLEYRYALLRVGTDRLETVRDFSPDPVYMWDTAGRREGLYRLLVEVRGKGGHANPQTMFADEAIYLKSP